MKRIHWLLLLLLIAGATLVIYQQNTAPYQHDEGKIFGTNYSITYQNNKNLHSEILAALNKVDASLSTFNEKSTVSRINKGEDIEVDGLFEDIFQKAQKISDVTNGAFDITVAPLVNAWGFGFKEDKWPSEQTIDSLKTFVGYKKVKLKARKLVKDDQRTMIDLSAIAKGYGVDMAAKVLDRAKVRNYMVEIGGEIVTKGKNAKGDKWKIGVAKPIDNKEEQKQYQCILQLSDCAMATSGNYRNFYYKDGVKYAHTIDPVSGRTVQQDIISATIVASNCYEADAYATSCMVMGLEKAKKMLAKEKQLEAYLIYTRDGKHKVWMTKGFEKCLVK
jgi:thiamine biosynthesis lipoprotein